MTRILEVSSSTATIVSDTIKVLDKASRYSPLDEAINVLAKKVQNRKYHNFGVLMTVVKTPVLTALSGDIQHQPVSSGFVESYFKDTYGEQILENA